MDIGDLPQVADIWGEGDWAETFGAGRACEYAAKRGDAGMMTAERIKRVLWITADSPEGYGSVDMACVAELEDGTFAIGEAWADTTGWGCRDDATWKVGPDIASVLAELSPENREAAAAAVAVIQPRL
jgi:hypothetical protein